MFHTLVNRPGKRGAPQRLPLASTGERVAVGIPRAESSRVEPLNRSAPVLGRSNRVATRRRTSCNAFRTLNMAAPGDECAP